MTQHYPYVRVRLRGSRQLIGLHRVRAVRACGRPLPKGAHVHHVDRDTDNPQARLVICQDAAYHHLLHVRMRVRDAGGDPNTEKVCASCRDVKPFEAFNRDRNSADGRGHRCTTCSAAQERTRRQARAAVAPPILTVSAQRTIAAGGHPETEKLCTACQLVKPLEAFSVIKTRRHCYCRPCAVVLALRRKAARNEESGAA